MGIRFETQDGRVGTLDVAKLAAEELNGVVIGADNGIVKVRIADGDIKRFALGEWAAENGVSIVQIEGFNSPDTALDEPPKGMNYIDQAVFFNDGADMDSLGQMFPMNYKRRDGRIVVLDSDGLWKTMWSPYTMPELPPLTFDEQVKAGIVHDPDMTIRTAGISFLLALAGIKYESTKRGGVHIGDIVTALEIIGRNAPYENRIQLGKLIEQSTGLKPWKFYNATLAPAEVGKWLHRSLSMSSFEFRMMQLKMTDVVADGLRATAQIEFKKAMKPLEKLEETKSLVINMKSIFSEFIQFLNGLDVLRDISKTTGLNEWLAVGEGQAVDSTKFEDMPQFVDEFIILMKWIMPIVNDDKLMIARGLRGYKSIISVILMIDSCIYHLAGIPDHAAKYKMFMALKRLLATIESKLAFIYHPDPVKNPDGMKENPFMTAKQIYGQKRELVYSLCQLPKETWNKVLLAQLEAAPNIERFYDRLDLRFAKLMKSFAAMDAAYDIQPWVDVEHKSRTHDSFSRYHEAFGSTPPEAGYLSKNSPRAVYNISETLIETAALLNEFSDKERNELLRDPKLLVFLIKTMMVSSTNRELGVVDILSKFGIDHDKDVLASPDPHRIWEDPNRVQKENEDQMMKMMEQIKMEQMMQQGAEDQRNQQAQLDAEALRDEGSAEAPQIGGPGPMGPPQQAMRARGA